MVRFLSINSENMIKIKGLKNAQTDAYINDATVTATLLDSDLNQVTGALALPGTASGAAGVYFIQIPDTVTLVDGATYYADVSIVSGTLNLLKRLTCKARYSSQ